MRVLLKFAWWGVVCIEWSCVLCFVCVCVHSVCFVSLQRGSAHIIILWRGQGATGHFHHFRCFWGCLGPHVKVAERALKMHMQETQRCDGLLPPLSERGAKTQDLNRWNSARKPPSHDAILFGQIGPRRRPRNLRFRGPGTTVKTAKTPKSA